MEDLSTDLKKHVVKLRKSGEGSAEVAERLMTGRRSVQRIFKALLRNASARTFQSLIEALADILPRTSEKDCSAFFRHAGCTPV